MQTVSFQLYSARNFPPLADVLKTVGTAGYKQVEGYGASTPRSTMPPWLLEG